MSLAITTNDDVLVTELGPRLALVCLRVLPSEGWTARVVHKRRETSQVCIIRAKGDTPEQAQDAAREALEALLIDTGDALARWGR